MERSGMRYEYRRRGGEPADEREHFVQCRDCGMWLDMRNLEEVLTHEAGCAITRQSALSIDTPARQH
jgi:hypothetical protein